MEHDKNEMVKKKKGGDNEIIVFANGLRIKNAMPSSVKLAPSELTEGLAEEDCYIVKFHNGFFFVIKGDSIYKLWKERKLVGIDLFLKVDDAAVENIHYINQSH